MRWGGRAGANVRWGGRAGANMRWGGRAGANISVVADPGSVHGGVGIIPSKL